MGSGEQEHRMVGGNEYWEMTPMLCVDPWVNALQCEMERMLSSIQGVETCIREWITFQVLDKARGDMDRDQI